MEGEEQNDDYDSPWKDAITRYLPEFMAFYFSNADAEIDWNRPHGCSISGAGTGSGSSICSR